ncbi:hypothetical protein C2S53_006562 [Perilla frutescens var. hirtella]|uniref:Uncharacterized protein n=1 Tax=Perilla frutescens var. hirtella TaxID=608512 RepID=A0AAD4JL54_PERFH|nr:hypothetical protein C2S53_006562 [Perilla frutescens var. hirtella]
MTVKPHEEESNFLPIMSEHQFLRKTASDVTNEMSKLGKELESITELDEVISEAECECCGLKEDYTKEYISRTRSSFSGKWVCGLCTEAVKEILHHSPIGVEEAMMNHKKFVQDFNTTIRLNPKLSLTFAMRDIAKRNCEKRKHLSGGRIKLIRTSSCVPRIDHRNTQQ